MSSGGKYKMAGRRLMHPMVSSGNHTHGDQASEERGPRYNCHPKDGHRKIHTSDSGHCSMKESQSPLQRTVHWGWSQQTLPALNMEPTSRVRPRGHGNSHIVPEGCQMA